jgi:hypothetical protein
VLRESASAPRSSRRQPPERHNVARSSYSTIWC